MSDLFPDAPIFPVALPNDELRLLGQLPEYPNCMEVSEEDWVAARRFKSRGLIKIHRWKSDPIALQADLFAGKIAPSLSLTNPEGDA